jgi:hypothetical protein
MRDTNSLGVVRALLAASFLRLHFILLAMVPLGKIGDTEHNCQQDKYHVNGHGDLLLSTLDLSWRADRASYM